jgi:hypothetical protein
MSNAVGRRRHHGHPDEILKTDQDESPQASQAAAAAAAAVGGGVVGPEFEREKNTMKVASSSPATVGGAAAVFYGTIAVAMGFINKAVMMRLPESNFLLLAQMVVTVAVMFSLRATGLVQFAPINLKVAKLLPVAIL